MGAIGLSYSNIIIACLKQYLVEAKTGKEMTEIEETVYYGRSTMESWQTNVVSRPKNIHLFYSFLFLQYQYKILTEISNNLHYYLLS